jgi:hypothetical protein
LFCWLAITKFGVNWTKNSHPEIFDEFELEKLR